MRFCPECGEEVIFEGYPEWGESDLTVYGCERCNILWECHGHFPTLRSRTEYYNRHTSRTLLEWREEKRIVYIHKGCGGKIIKKGQCSWCDKCKEYFCGCACG